MIIAFIAIGMVFGALASVVSLLTGGTVLMAFVIYGGVGCSITMLAIAAFLITSGVRESQDDWSETEPSTASA